MAIGLGLGWSERSPRIDPPTVDHVQSAGSMSSSMIDVHVSGWVHSPGVVRVAEGSMVVDAVTAAGGLLPGALTDRLNLAAPVHDGDQVLVPGPAQIEDPIPDSAGDGSLSLNRATASELEALPGVGPVLAQRIVAHRTEKGPFKQVEDLLDVPGIGEAKLASLRDLVRVP